MNILGIGTSIVECVRIGRMIQKHGELFLDRVFTPKEVRHCQKRRHPIEHYAEQWAAKEAVLKALGIATAKDLDWTELEIVHKAGRRSTVNWHGTIKDRADRQKVKTILLTMAHCRAYASAFALALSE